MTAPQYALMNALAFDRLPRARLDELLAEVQARPPFDGYQVTITGIANPTNADKVRALRHAHEAWIDALDAIFRAKHDAIRQSQMLATRAPDARLQPARRTLTRTQGGPPSITRGAEALAIFAAIPACPVWGLDPCTCAICTPQEAASQ